MPFTQDLVTGADVVDGRHKIGRMISCPHCKARVWIQEWIRGEGSTMIRPLFSICCLQGRVKVPEVAAEPGLLEMISDQSPEGVAFRHNVRKYNSALSFTSMGVTVDKNLASAQDGVYTYRIQGAVMHELGPLRAREGQEGGFAQIYFYDPNDQITRRQGIFSQINEDRLREVQTILETSNRFCHVYKTIREREVEEGPVEELKIVLKDARETNGRRQRQYDLPSANEIAVLMPGDEAATEPRDIIIKGRDGFLKRINETHPVYDPLQYTLLHPRGEDGWKFNTHLMIPKDQVDPAYPEAEAVDPDQAEGGAEDQAEDGAEDQAADDDQPQPDPAADPHENNDLEDIDPEDLDSDFDETSMLRHALTTPIGCLVVYVSSMWWISMPRLRPRDCRSSSTTRNSSASISTKASWMPLTETEAVLIPASLLCYRLPLPAVPDI